MQQINGFKIKAGFNWLGKKVGVCPICKEWCRLIKHHIVPLSIKKTSKQCLMICRGCESDIHRRFTNEELAKLPISAIINNKEKFMIKDQEHGELKVGDKVCFLHETKGDVWRVSSSIIVDKIYNGVNSYLFDIVYFGDIVVKKVKLEDLFLDDKEAIKVRDIRNHDLLVADLSKRNIKSKIPKSLWKKLYA